MPFESYLPVSGETGPLLILSVILLAGLLGGWLARQLRAPGVTGNILAGVLIGPTVLDLFGDLDVAEALRPLSTFAMGLIAVSVGSQLSYRRIHNALRRIIGIAVGEVIVVIALVTGVSRLIGADWPTALVLGSIAAATAPATTVALIRENRAKGTFVKTLLSVVALDNLLCIIFFAFTSTILADYSAREGNFSLIYAMGHTAYQFSGSLLLGIGMAGGANMMMRRMHVHDFSLIFIAILLCVGLSQYFGLSPLLTALFFGVYLGNVAGESTRELKALDPIELLLLICFFTVAGASLHFDNVREAGVLCVGYLVARFAGKVIGGWIGGRFSGASPRIRGNIGLALAPQAGVAIGLIVLLQGDPDVPQATAELISTLVLGAVTINEIIGPFFTRLALERTNEINKDRRRLMEFLQEEYILTNLKATDKWDALEQLVDFFAKTHRVKPASHETMLATVLERERSMSTAIGEGAAIPHGRVESGPHIQGVLGICRDGIDFDAPDGQPVRLIMLIVTPKGHETEHLEVLATLARMISHEELRDRLIAALNPNDAWEVIEDEETPNYNYYLDEGEDGAEEA